MYPYSTTIKAPPFEEREESEGECSGYWSASCGIQIQNFLPGKGNFDFSSVSIGYNPPKEDTVAEPINYFFLEGIFLFSFLILC